MAKLGLSGILIILLLNFGLLHYVSCVGFFETRVSIRFKKAEEKCPILN